LRSLEVCQAHALSLKPRTQSESGLKAVVRDVVSSVPSERICNQPSHHRQRREITYDTKIVYGFAAKRDQG
jgi:hypothetical protein